jgi:exosortase E/protease (VPEID-CTERM system)
VRWALPVALIVAEYLTISFLVDLPTSGPAMRLVAAVRVAIPVVIGAAAGAWLLERRQARLALREMAASLPPWRPGAALAANVAAFVATAMLARHLLGEGAPPVATGALAPLLACGALAALLALASAAPLRWTAHLVAMRWRVPLVALALGLLSWRAAAAAEGLWGVLSGGTLRAVAWLLRLVSPDVTTDPSTNLIAVGRFRVLIAPVCSGVDGLGLVLLFQSVWLSMARSRLRLRRALLLLPLGAAAALAANVLRIAILVLVGASGRRDLALGGLHSKLGWILFVAIALASVATAERLPWLQRAHGGAPSNAGAPSEDDGPPPAVAAYLAPLVAALATALVTSIWSDGALDLWYGVRIATALVVLLLVRRDLPRLSFSAPYLPVLLAAGVCAIWIPRGGAEGSVLAADLALLTGTGRWAWIAVRVAGSCLVIPLVEELAFRGFLLPWLASPRSEDEPARQWTWLAVIVSSAAFGALHERWILGTVAGLAFAAARLHRGRLGDAVLAHALSNAGIAAAVLLGGRWDLWG